MVPLCNHRIAFHLVDLLLGQLHLFGYLGGKATLDPGKAGDIGLGLHGQIATTIDYNHSHHKIKYNQGSAGQQIRAFGVPQQAESTQLLAHLIYLADLLEIGLAF